MPAVIFAHRCCSAQGWHKIFTFHAMSLVEYKKKRTFTRTPEPTGGKVSKSKLRFVVQKHAASRLHYDFRLEMGGVLKSWAVPKGPSLNPADKRLAMLVEDHPYDYRKFEGIIPEGNYGAGTVIIWDEGTYEPLEPTKGKAAQEKILLKSLKSGSLKFRLHGEKLKGEFVLVKTPRRADNAWLLIKHRDAFASDEDVTELDASVKSGKTLEELAVDPNAREWNSNKSSASSGIAKKASKKKEAHADAPSFRGLREDKRAKDVVWEEPIAAEEATGESPADHKIIKPNAQRADRKTLLNPGDETQVRKIEGHELKFTNLSKIFWPETGVTKRDMLNYYYQVVPFMLPYLMDRPQTLNRFPNGIHGKSFYQKDVTGKVPGWIRTHPYYSETDERRKHFLVISDEASLLYVASLGCIEMNPWSSRTDAPDNPDWCIIDLDPDKNTFDQVIEAARVTKDILDTMGIPGYCKTSGSTGLHIYIPLGAKYDYEGSKEFARVIAHAVHEELPSFTSIERLTSNRKGKMYVDFLQNRPQATVAGPYSLRPKPGAPVSMPLHWDEVKKGLRMTDFNIKNAMSRLKETGDLFKGVLGKGIDIENAVKKLK